MNPDKFPNCIMCDQKIYYRGSLGSMDLDGIEIKGKNICSNCAKAVCKEYLEWVE